MSKLHALTVPKWGMSMEEGTIAEWHVAVGEQVSVGDDLVDIETSKIVNTAESSCAGTLVRQVGQSGDVLPVAMLLGVVAEGDTNEAEIDAFIAAFIPDAAALNIPLGGNDDAAPAAAESEPAAAAPAPAPVVAKAAPKAQPSALSQGPDDSDVKASVVARRIAKTHNINLHNITPTGRHGRVSKQDIEQAAGIRVEAARSASQTVASVSPLAGRSSADDSRIAATPVARRLAAKMNINLNDVTPTGRRNRVTKEDIEKAAVALTGVADYREEKLSAMRKTIAARLSESKQNIPHYRVSMDIEIDSLLQQRKYMNASLGHAISVNDFIIKASASALQQVPAVNVQFAGDSIVQFDRADISMAVAVDGGLITPVIRNAGNKSLPQISAEAKDLATRAQQGQLTVDEFQGGTFSVSNLGMYGVDQFDAIINMPQAAILAIGAGKRKAVVSDDGIVAATVMRVSLSSDHRAIDGAVAAQFLQALKGFLENPASMLL
ncbi:Dihydrolipoyllysine-residue acetyltransferase component of pyruvate dehydrogenase complex [Sinobacterium norvegicum]|uniref:Dihydrolipoamide acetyltransferase component of pyruvate dehydrogenase complex n=1 Tax=Sinobacterium norvegicum TaxID=1641715 RepID=A0ABM9AIN4_9GAMM|nr:2-oxo acid dehydrogenase subunit E2 [Sinobacterium norvegicum]CAH0993084.1 Dihydrolipoyllysine-residue acetyltransferase component of pyruvate dehydrogenase complex [Sinobacterium norvegicum]